MLDGIGALVGIGNCMKLAYLTAEELEGITGYKTPRKQAVWLRKHGFTVFDNAKGRPIVSRSNFDLVSNGVGSLDCIISHEPDFRTLH